jgi:hypothetical protein
MPEPGLREASDSVAIAPPMSTIEIDQIFHRVHATGKRGEKKA